MQSTPTDWLNILKPNFKVLPLKERLLCGLGAFLGLLISSLLSWWILGGFNAWYIAPMGASSVLLFAVPASPLAQPWNVMVGNTLAACIGVSAALWIAEPNLALAVAVSLAIILMLTTDSLHPPSGAVAITAVLGGPEIHQLGYMFVVYPVLLNSLLLLVIAIFFNRLIGKHYPQRPQLNVRSKDPTPTQKVTIQPQDIQVALQQQTELLDISQYDLEKVILAAQQEAQSRGDSSVFLCRDIMSKDVVTLNMKDDILLALEKYKQMNLMSLPVVNAAGQLVGTLAMYQVVEWFQRSADMRSGWESEVGHIMSRKVITVRPEQPIQELVPYFVERSFNYIPVLERQQLVGIISRADMIAALQQQLQQKLY